MVHVTEDEPVYQISVVANLVGVHPETLRIWERNGLVKPKRKGNQRLYSNMNLRQLEFIHELINLQGLNLAGVSKIVELYPCWDHHNCDGGKMRSYKKQVNDTKPCWKASGTYCLRFEDKAEYCCGCLYQQRCQDCSNFGLHDEGDEVDQVV